MIEPEPTGPLSDGYWHLMPDPQALHRFHRDCPCKPEKRDVDGVMVYIHNEGIPT